MRGILETTYLHNPDTMGLFCHAPTILETSTGDLLVAWYSYPEVEYKNAQLALVRRPKGKPWEPSQQIVSNQILPQVSSNRTGLPSEYFWREGKDARKHFKTMILCAK